MKVPPQELADRWIDVAISMVEREEPRPELGDAILDRLRDEGVTELPRPWPRGVSSRGLLAAAAALLVVGAAGVALLGRGQPPVVERFVSTPRAVVTEPDEVRALPRDTRAVRLIARDPNAGFDAAAVEAVAALADLPALDELEVAGTRDFGKTILRAVPAFPDRGVAMVATLRGLRSLTFDDVAVSAAGLRELAALPALSRLRLRSVPAEDAHVAAVAGLAGLTEVAVVGLPRVTPTGYRALRRLQRLQVLDLSVPWVLWQVASRAAAGSSAPGQQAGFQADQQAELAASMAAVDDSVLGLLAELPDLRVLRLMLRRGVTDAGLAALGQLQTLEELVLSGCDRITDEGLARLPVSLRTLELAACPEVGRDLPTHLVELETLVVCSNSHIDDRQLARIVELPRLRVLDLRASMSITRDGARQLARAQQLEELWLCGAPWLDDEALRTAAQLPQLRELAVAGFGEGTRITGAGLAHLARLPRLEVLRIPQMRPFSVADLTALENLPLRVLDVSRNRIGFDARHPDLESLRSLWPGVEIEAVGMVPQ